MTRKDSGLPGLLLIFEIGKTVPKVFQVGETFFLILTLGKYERGDGSLKKESSSNYDEKR